MKLTTNDFRDTARELIEEWQKENDIELDETQKSNLVTEMINYNIIMMTKATDEIKQ
jgi:hypothetical protein